MVSFNTVYPSTRHPSLLSPSVLTILPSFLSFLYPPVCCLSLWSGGNARSMYRHICLNCQHQPPPLTLPLLFPSSLSCYSSSSYFFFFFLSVHLFFFSFFYSSLLQDRASPRCVESHSVWCLAALLFLCTTSLHHANLWLALHRGLLTTHACLHATRSEWRRLHSH